MRFNNKVYEAVDLSSIKHDVNVYTNSRTFLEYEYKTPKKGKELWVVLKNPSKSFYGNVKPSYDVCFIDRTTYNVMKAIDVHNSKTKANKYKKIIIINLFPEFSTKAKIINKIYNFSRGNVCLGTCCYRYNHINIVNRLKAKKKNSLDVLFAWGKNSGINKYAYDIAICEMLSDFVNFDKYEYKNKQIIKNNSLCVHSYPLHPQRG